MYANDLCEKYGYPLPSVCEFPVHLSVVLFYDLCLKMTKSQTALWLVEKKEKKKINPSEEFKSKQSTM